LIKNFVFSRISIARADRTLYEEVRLDREPRRPSLLSAPKLVSDTSRAPASTSTPQEPATGWCVDVRPSSAMAAHGSRMDDGEATQGEVGHGGIDQLSSEDEEAEEEEESRRRVEVGSTSRGDEARLGVGMTLSGLPRSRWETLFYLDLVRARNRPIAPVAPPPQATPPSHTSSPFCRDMSLFIRPLYYF